MRRALAAITLIVTVAAVPDAVRAEQADAAATLLDDYKGGLERQALFERFLPTEQAYVSLRSDLFQRIRALREQGEPLGTIFLLDLSIWAVDREFGDAPALVRMAQDILFERPELPGASPPRDRIEVLYHRAAVTILIVRRRHEDAERYLDRLKGRIWPDPSPLEPRLVDPHLMLLRALLAEARAMPGIVEFSDREPTRLMPRAGDRSTRRRLERALEAFEAAERYPEVAPEALVRRGIVLVRLGRAQEALGVLSRVEEPQADTVQRYWTSLFRGRALETLKRSDEAALAYEQALRIWPRAQTPMVALASLYQRAGVPDRARQWAAQVGALTESDQDPWWHYWAGSGRFIKAWLAEMRVAHP
jgi:tetratricopeptide (TPR) repeat protein